MEDLDQTLDDAEIYYTELDQLILLKTKPYKENEYRYFIFNNKLKTVIRIDSIKDSCILLPGNHGLIFPNGYYLQTGEYKVFDVESDQSIFDERISSINGEDYQYIFYSVDTGLYLMYSYNIIEQKIDTPIVCSGYSHFNNGEMIVVKHESEPRKNHMMQVWQTPYVGKNYVNAGTRDSVIFNIGNKDIVNAMADCKGIYKLIEKKDGYQSIYVDIVKECERITDSYCWLDKEETFNLRDILLSIKESASSAVGEFEKVLRIKSATKKQIEQASKTTEELLSKLKYGTFETIHEYVNVLAEIRNLRGQIACLRELRYIDLNLVSSLDQEVKGKNDEFSEKCVEFLLAPEGLKPYGDRVQELQNAVDAVTKSMEGKELGKQMIQTSSDLELLIDIISNFKIEDPTMTTEIIEKISALFSLLNNGKARLTNRLSDLTKNEMKIQFFSQIKLLSQW